MYTKKNSPVTSVEWGGDVCVYVCVCVLGCVRNYPGEHNKSCRREEGLRRERACTGVAESLCLPVGRMPVCVCVHYLATHRCKFYIINFSFGEATPQTAATRELQN